MPTLGLLTLLFLLSGGAGLIYESIWARYLGLFVGHDAYGQITVLVIFLGGMSLGAAAVSRFTGRLKSPLLAYAVVELVAGGMGLVFHDVYLRVTEQAYASLYPALAGSAWLSVVKWTIAGGLILPQSILLGATFPLMAAGALRLSPLPEGRILAQLYFANSFGAAVGVLVAGFYLVGQAGLAGTLYTAAALNILVGLGTAWIASATGSRALAAAAPVAAGEGSSARRRLLLAVTFGTAVASFIYEIGWIRMLSLVLGSATHSFELMLSAFILGLAGGSLAIRSHADRIADPFGLLGWIQWLMGLAALATLPVYGESFSWMAWLLETFARTDGGYLGFTVSRYAICLAVMFPATFLAGMTLPLITRALMTHGAGERAVGAVYAVNTLGSIVGVMLAGLILLPWVGLKAMLVVGAVLDMGLGVLLFLSVPRAGRRLGYVLAGATAAIVLATVLLVRLERGVLVSGVFRRGAGPVPESSVVFYRDGRTATVSAVRALDGSETYLATNGKSDASLTREWFVPCHARAPRVPLHRDAATQTVAPLIALAHAPAARTAAVIGHGSGISSHHLLASSRLGSVVTVEIEPEMIHGSRVFYPHNRRVFDDRRSRLVIDDAKSYFAARQATYDLILSEPSNPWVSGVAGLFSVEFYDRVRRHLSPDGIFAQWLHLYESDDDLALAVLAAIHRSFPAYEIFLTAEHDMLIMAGKQSRLPEPDWSVVSLPGIQQDLCRFVPLTPATLEAGRLGGRKLLGPLLEGGVPANSDFHPVLDVGAEKRRFLGGNATGLHELATARFSPAGLLEDRRRGLPDEASMGNASVPGVWANSVAAQVRAVRSGSAFDRSGAADAALPIFTWRLWRTSLESGPPPSSWRVWAGMFLQIERTVSGAARGVADEEFYASVYRFLDRHRAPPPVRHVVEFHHGLASWDWSRTISAATGLIPEYQRRRYWFAPDELRDGAVIASLRLGEPGRARRLFRLLAPMSERPPAHLRNRLLEAHLREADGGR